MKSMSIIALVISGLGIIGSLALMSEGDESGVIGLMVYAFFLAYSIMSLTKKQA